MRLGRSLASLIGEGEGVRVRRGGRPAHRARSMRSRPGASTRGGISPKRRSRSLRSRSASAGWCSRSWCARSAASMKLTRSSPANGAGARRSAPICTRCRSSCARSPIKEAIEIAIIENVQREDLNAIEEAEGYRLLMDGHGYTQEDLAKVIGKSRSHLANTLRLLKLPESVQVLLRSGALSAGHARCLIGRADAAALAERIVNEGLTVRQVEALVQDKPAVPGKAAQDKGEECRHARRRVRAERGAWARCRYPQGPGREGRASHPLHDPRPARGCAPPAAAAPAYR